jgi:hypothetical protein
LVRTFWCNAPSSGPCAYFRGAKGFFKTTLALIDVRVLDHVIVAPGEALSMAEKGLI